MHQEKFQNYQMIINLYMHTIWLYYMLAVCIAEKLWGRQLVSY